jgi:hypothetical protein
MACLNEIPSIIYLSLHKGATLKTILLRAHDMSGFVAHDLSGLGWSPMEVTDETDGVVTGDPEDEI